MNAYVVVDIETTGAHPVKSDIIEIGAVYVENNIVKESFNELVQPNQEISSYITGITGITNEMVQNKRTIEKVLPDFIRFCKEVPLIGHNIMLFDYRMLKAKATMQGLPFEKQGLDTLIISRKMLKELPSRRLGDLCTYYAINLERAHRAYEDAFATYELFVHLQQDFSLKDPKLFEPQMMQWDMPKNSPQTAKQKNYLLSLCKRHGLEVTSEMQTLTKSECSKMIDCIIHKYGKY